MMGGRKEEKKKIVEKNIQKRIVECKKNRYNE